MAANRKLVAVFVQVLLNGRVRIGRLQCGVNDGLDVFVVLGEVEHLLLLQRRRRFFCGNLWRFSQRHHIEDSIVERGHHVAGGANGHGSGTIQLFARKNDVGIFSRPEGKGRLPRWEQVAGVGPFAQLIAGN